jgi:hypothetical protein
MVDRLSPGDGSVGSAGGKCRHVGREPERRADAIRRLARLALNSDACEPINFALINSDTGMEAADCIRPTHRSARRYRQLDDARDRDLDRTRRAARSRLNPIWKSDFKMDMSTSHRR